MDSEHCGIIITNIGKLATFANSDAALSGEAMREPDIIENAAIAIRNDKIIAVGTIREILARFEAMEYIDALGALVTPGLIDAHTHPVFLDTRSEEFEMRLAGKTYEEILEAGGGIYNSANQLRAVNSDALKEPVRKRLSQMLEFGTTTVEAKSGYGLSRESEIASLEVLSKVKHFAHVDVVPTFLGAHVVPEEYAENREEYINLIVDMLPEIVQRNLAEFIDVFIEKSAFSAEEAKIICEAAKEVGLKIRLHTNQFNSIGGIQLAAEVGALTVDHLEVLDDDEIKILKKAGLMPVLLPGCSFFLGDERYPDARKLIDADLPVVLATDFNPGSSYILSLQFIMTLALLKMKMTPAEALAAMTVNAAYALDKGDKVGRIKPDYNADIVIWKVADIRDIPYSVAQNQVRIVVKDGRIAVDRTR